MDARSSAPMPSPIPTPPRTPTGSHAALETESARALRIAIEARDLGRELRADLGREPSDEDDEGEGLRGRVAMLERFVGRSGDVVRGRVATGAHALLSALSAAIERLTVELSADREQRERAAARASRVAWGVGIPVVVALLLGAGAIAWRWLSTLHH